MGVIRHVVMYRKTSFDTQSDAGSRFVERTMTVLTPSVSGSATSSTSSAVTVAAGGPTCTPIPHGTAVRVRVRVNNAHEVAARIVLRGTAWRSVCHRHAE